MVWDKAVAKVDNKMTLRGHIVEKFQNARISLIFLLSWNGHWVSMEFAETASTTDAAVSGVH